MSNYSVVHCVASAYYMAIYNSLTIVINALLRCRKVERGRQIQGSRYSTDLIYFKLSNIANWQLVCVIVFGKRAILYYNEIYFLIYFD